MLRKKPKPNEASQENFPPQTAPDNGDNDALSGAIFQLDDGIDDHWTKAGVPNVNHLQNITGLKNLTRKQVEAISDRQRITKEDTPAPKTTPLSENGYILLTNLRHDAQIKNQDFLQIIKDIFIAPDINILDFIEKLGNSFDMPLYAFHGNKLSRFEKNISDTAIFETARNVSATKMVNSILYPHNVMVIIGGTDINCPC